MDQYTIRVATVIDIHLQDMNFDINQYIIWDEISSNCLWFQPTPLKNMSESRLG